MPSSKFRKKLEAKQKSEKPCKKTVSNKIVSYMLTEKDVKSQRSIEHLIVTVSEIKYFHWQKIIRTVGLGRHSFLEQQRQKFLFYSSKNRVDIALYLYLPLNYLHIHYHSLNYNKPVREGLASFYEGVWKSLSKTIAPILHIIHAVTICAELGFKQCLNIPDSYL